VLAAAAVLALLRPADVRADPVLTLRATSQSIRPGDLVVLTLTSSERLDGVEVTVFDRHVAGFDAGDNRWRAIVGVDLDQRPGRYTAAVDAIAGGTSARRSLNLVVGRRSFPTRKLTVEPDFVNPPPDVVTRIQAEQQFLRSMYADSAMRRLWEAAFIRPVPQPANSRFGSRSVYNGVPRSPHAGTDFLSPAGTPVKAPNAGRVVAARDLFFTGNTIVVDHGLGMFSTLAHLSRIDVREGDLVVAGQLLGLVGATGRVTGPHLHWAVSVSGARVDPLSLLRVLGEPGAQGPEP
jgi:murein DD-endopeptidase MepM/ murein hydrolase activator NlpD